MILKSRLNHNIYIFSFIWSEGFAIAGLATLPLIHELVFDRATGMRIPCFLALLNGLDWANHLLWDLQ